MALFVRPMISPVTVPLTVPTTLVNENVKLSALAEVAPVNAEMLKARDKATARERVHGMGSPLFCGMSGSGPVRRA